MSLLVWILIIFILLFLFILYKVGWGISREAYIHEDDEHWISHLPDDPQGVVHSVFLIGDNGAPSLPRDPVHDLLGQKLMKAGKDSTVVFLGDLIYPKGLPPEGHRLRDLAEKRMQVQIDMLKDYEGKIVYIPGNHDWNKGRKGGYEFSDRLEKYITSRLNKGTVYYPPGGCPGPEVLELSEKTVLIVINTQWWVQSGTRPMGKQYGCKVETEEEFFDMLRHELETREDKHIIIAAHHPLYSNSYHGGKFPIKQHLFPLTAAHKKLYIPFPVAGSIYPLYRKYFGAVEDMAHPRYRRMRKQMLEMIRPYPDLVFAGGHDHNLQYLKKGRQHHIVSGAGSKVAYVKKRSGASFSHAHRGFFKITYYEDEQVWLEVWEPMENDPDGVLAYRKRIV